MAPASNSTVTIIKSDPWPRICRRTPSPTFSHATALVLMKRCPAIAAGFDAVSDKIQPAVDLDRFAGDVRGHVGREEQHCVRHIVGMSFATDGRARNGRFAAFGLRVQIV